MQLSHPPGGRPWGLFMLLGGSLGLNIFLVSQLGDAGASMIPDAKAAMVSEPPDQWAAGEQEANDIVVTADGIVSEEALAQPIVEPAVERPDGLNVLEISVSHSLARSFSNSAPGAHADVVAAVYARLFFWDLDLRRDLQRGDTINVAYEWDGVLAQIPVASYFSNKLNRRLRAYRFQADDSRFSSYWDERGREVGYRLVDGPLQTYEQVTSLLKDRPTHKGMDFKAPEGTEVVAPRDGTITRTNWNLAFNGNCVEMRYSDGTLARFLHLSKVSVARGTRITAGQAIGATGNTGRSTAPHLHYELERHGRVLDPIDYHGVQRRSLTSEEMIRFAAVMKELDGWLQTEG